MEQEAQSRELEAFDRLVADWTQEATHPMVPGTVVGGRMSYGWLEGRRFLIQRWSMEHPEFPDSISVIGSTDSDDGLTSHYFDSRGVFRVYRTRMEGETMRLWRDAPGFSQRLEAKLSDDESILSGI